MGEAGALFTPPINSTCEGRWLPVGPGDGSIRGCHGDSGCILRQARASLVQPRRGVPRCVPLPAAVLGESRAGARVLAWHPRDRAPGRWHSGDRAPGRCQLGLEQRRASRSSACCSGCVRPPSLSRTGKSPFSLACPASSPSGIRAARSGRTHLGFPGADPGRGTGRGKGGAPSDPHPLIRVLPCVTQ